MLVSSLWMHDWLVLSCLLQWFMGARLKLCQLLRLASRQITICQIKHLFQTKINQLVETNCHGLNIAPPDAAPSMEIPRGFSGLQRLRVN